MNNLLNKWLEGKAKKCAEKNEKLAEKHLFSLPARIFPIHSLLFSNDFTYIGVKCANGEFIKV